MFIYLKYDLSVYKLVLFTKINIISSVNGAFSLSIYAGADSDILNVLT